MFNSLPFLAKFMGDGVLFLYDVRSLSDQEVCNIVFAMWYTCDAYSSNFLPTVKEEFSHHPPQLRCGIARDKVFSVGNEEDYIGASINLASRLQKLGLLTFACSRTAINLRAFGNVPADEDWVVKAADIRGVSEREHVWLRRSQYDEYLAAHPDQTTFLNPS